jgi:oxygen-dependent protoporphyrinogen oxidase
MTAFDRVVIGAGLAGLLAALRACNRGERVIVVDSADVLGGTIARQRLGDVEIDSGAESFSTAGDAVTRLVESLGGLEWTPPEPRRAHIVNGQQRYPIPEGILGIPRSLDDPNLRLALEPETIAKAKQADTLPWSVIGSLSDVVANRLGPAFVDAFVRPVVAGVHSAAPEEVSADSLIGEVLDIARTGIGLVAAVDRVRAKSGVPGTAVGTIVGGMFTLIERLRELLTELGVEFRLATSVRSLTRTDDTWGIETTPGRMRARSVTIAGGVDSLALVRDAVPELGEFTDAVRPSDSYLAFALIESTALNEFPVGTGVLVAPNSGFATKAITHVNAKWGWQSARLEPNQHIIRMSVAKPAGHEELSLERIAQLGLEEFGPVLGIDDAHVFDVRATTWRGRLASLAPGATPDREALVEIADTRGLELCGSVLARNGLLAIAKEHYERTAS